MLQLKTGRLDPAYFRQKFKTDILATFGDSFAKLEHDGFLHVAPGEINLTRSACCKSTVCCRRFSSRNIAARGILRPLRRESGFASG